MITHAISEHIEKAISADQNMQNAPSEPTTVYHAKYSNYDFLFPPKEAFSVSKSIKDFLIEEFEKLNDQSNFSR